MHAIIQCEKGWFLSEQTRLKEKSLKHSSDNFIVCKVLFSGPVRWGNKYVVKNECYSNRHVECKKKEFSDCKVRWRKLLSVQLRFQNTGHRFITESWEKRLVRMLKGRKKQWPPIVLCLSFLWFNFLLWIYVFSMQWLCTLFFACFVWFPLVFPSQQISSVQLLMH